MSAQTFVYATYIAASKEQVWDALTNGDITEQYFFGTRVESEWTEGSDVNYYREGQVCDYGSVLKCDPYKLLSYTWINSSDKYPRTSPTVVTFKFQPMGEAVKLTLKHENLLETDYIEDEDTFVGFNNGWPAILSNLKTFLETGKVLNLM
ncbi:SRPBCC family protein [Falsibacillus pallidus]|uniref:Uncharacterized protein YndB with AHSA1/START domain n=1 Tax=Falsibacillus pallidus TaxID=493781 RepID=A0A370GQ64_9BACI|nr:SRPBCC family protein [Falsibacillus pallidus]RDI45651.1 uncharacterized protein YndB with AHSA1/START domain [Falsibacillus pallidus]